MNNRVIDGGSQHSVFVTENGVFAAGSNFSGQLGIKGCLREKIPRRVSTFNKGDIVSVGCCDYSTMFLTKDGRVYSSGSNEEGELGIGSEFNCSSTPKLVVSLSSEHIIQVACGFNFVMTLSSSGFIFGWGANSEGQLGLHGNYLDELDVVRTPEPIENLYDYDVRTIACGEKHTLALTCDGKLLSWGGNNNGQLGIGNRSSTSKPTIVKTSKLHKIVQVACGREHNIAVTKGSGGQTICFSWGGGYRGQLGHGDQGNRLQPKMIEALKGERVILVDCGTDH